MLDMAKLTKDDFHIDLGSGDGRIAVTAAKRGARSKGIDLNPTRIAEANENAKKAGVTDRVTFVLGNLFEQKLGEADVLTMYLLQSVNLQLRPRILDELRPGSRVVSHAFSMNEWEPDQHVNLNGRNLYLWIVPGQGRGHLAGGERRAQIHAQPQADLPEAHRHRHRRRQVPAGDRRAQRQLHRAVGGYRRRAPHRPDQGQCHRRRQPARHAVLTLSTDADVTRQPVPRTGGLPLPWGEGWGEGVDIRLERRYPLTPPLSPVGEGAHRARLTDRGSYCRSSRMISSQLLASPMNWKFMRRCKRAKI